MSETRGRPAYYVCYEHPERGPVHAVADDEDAMRRVVHGLVVDLDVPEDEIHVFAAASEL